MGDGCPKTGCVGTASDAPVCVHAIWISVDLLVSQFLFFNLIFWILCLDFVIHVCIKIAWLLLVCTPFPPHGLGEPEDFEGALLQTAFMALRHCGTAGSLDVGEILHGPTVRPSLSRSSSPPRTYFLCALGLEFELLL